MKITKNKKILVTLGIMLIILVGVIKLNYSKIAWLVYPEQYAKEVLPHPELEVSVIKKDEKSYLYVQSRNCPWSRSHPNDNIINDEQTLSSIIKDYKMVTYRTSKGFSGRFDDKKLLIEIKDNNPIIQNLVCEKDLFDGLEHYRGARETQVKLENGIISIRKL